MHLFIRNILILSLSLLSVNIAFSQLYNREIEAKIDIENNHEFINVTATAYNKTSIDQSLYYVFSAIRTKSEDDTQSKEDITNYFTLKPNEKISLYNIVANADETDRIIFLLLVYDLNDEIKGKDRVVFNEETQGSEVQGEVTISREPTTVITNSSFDVDESNSDGVVLSGIVLNETKTKPGQDFYNYFYSTYSLNKIDAEKIVVIKELFAMGITTQIQVLVDDVSVFEFFVNPRQEFLKAASDVAIARVSHYLESAIKQNLIRHY